ncbi:MAG: DUF262 domain-containing protein [Flavisolibacter sp.]
MAGTSIRNFFTGKYFDIPKYQRGYAWDRENIRDLFEDLQESIDSGTSHYIGTIVLSHSPEDEEKFFVVDGQQRITTLTMIISCLIQQLPESDRAFFQRFYIKEDGKYRLRPLNRDQQFLISLLDGEVKEPTNKSQRLLANAIEEIQFKVDGIVDKVKYLKTIEKLEVVEFIENSEGDAIRIFETVNDRGKPLSNMEKVKSLLIYYSNRYLQKSLDDNINEHFSDIFEYYDDIKHTGEQLNINLIKNRDFTEDNLMRYHFVTFSDSDYDPTSNAVLTYIKARLKQFRSTFDTGGQVLMADFIQEYIKSLRAFFYSCKAVIDRVEGEPAYYKLFVILNLSATLYPLIVKLSMLDLLDVDADIPEKQVTFFHLIELIEVRVYKTRGTDPKRDIAWFVYNISSKTIVGMAEWLLWFNERWMTSDQFRLILSGSLYGNRALSYMFIEYCEMLKGRPFTISELRQLYETSPTIEHILSQTPNFDPAAFGFKGREEFIEYEHRLGNLTVIEKGLNSTMGNNSIIEKLKNYDRSRFESTRKLSSDIDTIKEFTKTELETRTAELVDFFSRNWWC